MKKLIVLLSIVFLIISCEKKEPLPPNTYKINVSAPGVLNGIRAYIKIIGERNQEVNIDTAMVINEQFTFTGDVTYPAIRMISVNSVPGHLSFILEPGEIDVTLHKDSIMTSVAIGTENNNAYNTYKQNFRSINHKMLKLREESFIARRDGDTATYNALGKEYQNLARKLMSFPYDYIKEHPYLDLSLLLLESQINEPNQNINSIKESLSELEDVVNKNPSTKFIGQKLNAYIAHKESEAMLDIGRKAPEFKSPNPDGEMISLEDIKGRATIIDFWAAWCGPCRRENPNIVRIYEKYHDKGLEIIGVSLDGRSNQSDAKQQWLKAIEDDGLPWHHVSSLMYFRDPVAELYNINSIPATFVLDENGIIVGKKLRGQALENKIAELLD